MILFGPSYRYYFYRTPTDMRKSFDGLSGLVRSGLHRDPLSGDVFVFINGRRNLIKLLVWDDDGFVIYYKRLESGTFETPKGSTPTWLEMAHILAGVSLASVRYRKRVALPVDKEV